MMHRYHIIYGNSTTLNQRAFFHSEVGKCDVTQPTTSWLWLKN